MIRLLTRTAVFAVGLLLGAASYAQTSQPNAPSRAAPAGAATEALNQEDQIDMQVFNQAIWESVKGANSPMPAPRHILGGTVSSPPAGADN